MRIYSGYLANLLRQFLARLYFLHFSHRVILPFLLKTFKLQNYLLSK